MVSWNYITYKQEKITTDMRAMSDTLKGTAEAFSADKLFPSSCFSLENYGFFLKCANFESIMNQSLPMQMT